MGKRGSASPWQPRRALGGAQPMGARRGGAGRAGQAGKMENFSALFGGAEQPPPAAAAALGFGPAKAAGAGAAPPPAASAAASAAPPAPGEGKAAAAGPFYLLRELPGAGRALR